MLAAAEEATEGVNTAAEGRLKRSSLTAADASGADKESVVLLVGPESVCLHRRDRPALPVENLQRPPHGLENE